MITAWDVVIAVLLALLGALLLFSAMRALGPSRRLRSVPTRPVADVAAAGLVEVAGVIRAAGEPLRAADGRPAVALRTRLGYSYKSTNGKHYQTLPKVVRESSAPAEIADASGSCALGFDHVILLAPRAEYAFEPGEFARRFPELWAHVDEKHRATATEVRLEEWAVPHGVTGFAAGEASPDDSHAPGDGYRATKRRWRVSGTERRPLLLSAWSESEGRRYLLRPVVLLAWAGALCWAASALLVACVLDVGRAAGL